MSGRRCGHPWRGPDRFARRGDARPDSDIDLIILTTHPARLLNDRDWIGMFGRVGRANTEDWGLVQPVRVFHQAGPEVEFGMAHPTWAALPLDEGTRVVITGGVKVLLDRDGDLATAVHSLRADV